MTNCTVCQEETKKYKCPKCEEPYCSLNCYKEHKKQECEAKPVNTTPAAEPELEQDLEPTVHQPFCTEDTVPREKLLELKDSASLRTLLLNPHLRKLLQQIDVAPNAWKAMRAAMQEPLFIEFADECLKVVEPLTALEQQEQELMNTT